ncbi:MAG: Ig-like domain-containing protein, partial [Acutalibacteraceae bacterium]|nr:Ig-like domain-containing protein [Acutalibacteraceae bacterium]
MKKTNKALALLLSALMAATAFCSVPLSASAEENKGVENQTVVAEVPTESETEGASESTTENIEEVSSEPVVNTGYSRAEKTVQNESAVANNMVESSASVESVEISSSITLGVSETYTFSKTSLQKALSTNSSATYKWSSSNSNIVSVNSSGKITAKKVGETTINVVASNGKKGFCKVVVKNAPARIYLNKIGVTLGAGETFDLSASLPSGTASYSIKFSSNNTSVATVNSTSGLITAKKVGTAVITATTYNGKTATCTVTVKNAPDKITLNKTAITLGVGETFRISLSLPSGTAAYNIKVGSNNPSVAVFNTSSGQITAKKVGTAVITFTAYNGKKASCTVTVKNAPDKITLNKTAVTLGVGETFDLNATLPSGTASYSIKFSSGSTSVATVNSTSGLITAKKVGTAV